MDSQLVRIYRSFGPDRPPEVKSVECKDITDEELEKEIHKRGQFPRSTRNEKCQLLLPDTPDEFVNPFPFARKVLTFTSQGYMGVWTVGGWKPKLIASSGSFHTLGSVVRVDERRFITTSGSNHSSLVELSGGKETRGVEYKFSSLNTEFFHLNHSNLERVPKPFGKTTKVPSGFILGAGDALQIFDDSMGKVAKIRLPRGPISMVKFLKNFDLLVVCIGRQYIIFDLDFKSVTQTVASRIAGIFETRGGFGFITISDGLIAFIRIEEGKMKQPETFRIKINLNLPVFSAVGITSCTQLSENTIATVSLEEANIYSISEVLSSDPGSSVPPRRSFKGKSITGLFKVNDGYIPEPGEDAREGRKLTNQVIGILLPRRVLFYELEERKEFSQAGRQQGRITLRKLRSKYEAFLEAFPLKIEPKEVQEAFEFLVQNCPLVRDLCEVVFRFTSDEPLPKR